MFKSIEYKFIIYILLLISSVIAATCFFIGKHIEYGSICVLVALFSLHKLYKHYNRFNRNILFLLNALENGDYSFHFSETKLSRRERELNIMLNRIKDILNKARNEIVENEKFLSIIVESVSTGIIILNEKNNIILVNKATNDLLGLHIFTHLNQLAVINESYPELFRNLNVNDHKQIKTSNDREEIQINLQATKVKLKKGTFKIITLHNIGNELEAKEIESWIRLIRVMTHEIMNSIAPITSLSEILLFSQKDKNTENRSTIEALETINSTAKGLISFVESYRKFTGIPKPQMQVFELKPLLEQIVYLESNTIKEKGIDIHITGKDMLLYADKDQVMQILVNLLKNAVEAIDDSRHGIININMYQVNGKTQIDVSNNGKQIPADILPHIFVPFFTTKDTGTGIGLSISRHIMRLHGGKLQHSVSAEGQTTFSMVFDSTPHCAALI